MKKFTIKKMRFMSIYFAIAMLSGFTTSLSAQANVKWASPELTVSATSLTGFTYFGYGPSAEQSFTVSGTDLTDNIVVSVSDKFKISTISGMGFVFSKTFTQTGGLVPLTTIYVRLIESQNVGIYTSDITVSSAGATDKTIACSGSVITADPNLHFTQSTINKTVGEGVFTQLAISDGNSSIGYASSDLAVATINQTSGEVTLVGPGTAVITASQLEGRGYYAATATYNLNVTLGPVINISPFALSGISYGAGTGPSSEQGLTVRGSLLTDNMIITPPANFEISTVSGNSFVATDPIALVPVDGIVLETVIYVRLKAGLHVESYSGDILFASTGATSKSLACSGEVTCANSNIQFGVTTVNKTNLDFVFTEIAYSDNIAPILYSSSQEAVALIDEVTGEVTLVGFGTTNITASQVEGDGYCAKSASYTIKRTDTTTSTTELTIPLNVWVKDGAIQFSAAAGENVAVYNAVGQKLLGKSTVEGLNSISLTQQGVVLVKVGSRVTKVIL